MDDAKRKALDAALSKIEKQYGKGSIMKMSDNSAMNVEAISTGSLNLDIALGVGGLPRGRIIEIYGPESTGKSTLAMHCVAEAQKLGNVAGYVDAEHAMDPAYAKKIGVDIDNLYISQPNSGEQGLEITETMVRSGAFDIVVVDSVAALVPQAEIDGEMGDMQVGAQARLMSKACRKLTSAINESKCIVIFINQIREKVGVMYGCLHADTLVNFTDGRSIPIKKVVEEQIGGMVWSYNEETGLIEPKEIIDWHYNGDVEKREDYIHIETTALDTNNGTVGFTVTPDHKVLTANGWKEAKNLTMSDKLVTHYASRINGTLADFMYGVAIGDSHISKRAKNTAMLRLQDSNNVEYMKWKASKISVAFPMHENNMRMESDYCSELALLKDEIQNRDPEVMLNSHYSDLGLAVWFMDDGHSDFEDYHSRATISVKRFKNNIEKLELICEALKQHGLIATIRKSDGAIIFDKENTDILFTKIAKFVPDCMQYKLSKEFRGLYEDFTLLFEDTMKTGYVDIKLIREASEKQFRQKGKYDISVEGNHNYMVGNYKNGIIVHNSPETTTGGRALKYYSSVRLDIRKVEALKQGGEVIGNHVRVKVVKNKVAPPFREAEFDILFGKGISKDGEVIDAAVSLDIIEKAGAWFYYTDKNGEKQRWQGREKAKEALLNNKSLMQEVEEKIVAKMRPSLMDGPVSVDDEADRPEE